VTRFRPGRLKPRAVRADFTTQRVEGVSGDPM
jgi:hypothetical protein